jgi:hypothetical protein
MELLEERQTRGFERAGVASGSCPYELAFPFPMLK